MKGNSMEKTRQELKKEMDKFQEYIASQNPEEDEAPEQKTGKPSKRQSMKQKQDSGELSAAPSGPVLSM